MKRLLLLLALAAVTGPAALAVAPPAAAAPLPNSLAGRFLVQLRPGVDAAALAQEYRQVARAKVSRVYQETVDGFAAALSPAALRRLQGDPRVAVVEPDMAVAATVQHGAPWGLDRLDQRDLPLSTTYDAPASGEGVTVYVLDSGVRPTHAEFAGRLAAGVDTTGAGTTDDCNGHGTHVAGTIAGTTYGVAKRVGVVPVRVLGCNGAGTGANLVAGLEWVAAHHQAGTPAVANLSLAASGSTVLDNAVRSLIADGVTVVVAAGNRGEDACKASPARVTEAITVGATDATDTRPSFSNFGRCLDLFAPGVAIASAGISGDTAAAVKSGTSMAAPHVAGVAALVVQAEPAATPTVVGGRVVAQATPQKVRSAGKGSPTLLVHAAVGSTSSVSAPAAPAVPGTPTSVVAVGGRRSAKVMWTAPTTGGAVTSYRVRAHTSSGAVVKTVTVTATTATVPRLRGGQTYRFTVVAVNATGVGAPSAPSNAVTVR